MKPAFTKNLLLAEIEFLKCIRRAGVSEVRVDDPILLRYTFIVALVEANLDVGSAIHPAHFLVLVRMGNERQCCSGISVLVYAGL